MHRSRLNSTSGIPITRRLGTPVIGLGVCLILLLSAAGCATYPPYRARFHEPDYVITAKFFEEAPQKVVVLPFAYRAQKKEDRLKADICRKAFFQHFILRGFEDEELHGFEQCILDEPDKEEELAARRLANVIQKLDIVGMTTVLDVESLFDQDDLDDCYFLEMVQRLRQEMQADAYVAGLMRSYGRFYALVFSTIGISTRLEIHSTKTGELLWRAEAKQRDYSVPVTLNPLDVPFQMIHVWRNSRGLAMDMLAYRVYRELVKTIPYVPEPMRVKVKTTKKPTPFFRAPSTWKAIPDGQLPEGQLLEFVLEKRGWYQCRLRGDQDIWVFSQDGMLVDETGHRVNPHADIPNGFQGLEVRPATKSINGIDPNPMPRGFASSDK